MEVSGQLHAPANLTPGEMNPISRSVGGLVGSRFGLNFCTQQIHLSPLWVIVVGCTVLISIVDTGMSVLKADTVQTQLLFS
jgi:hypothetical protein